MSICIKDKPVNVVHVAIRQYTTSMCISIGRVVAYLVTVTFISYNQTTFAIDNKKCRILRIIQKSIKILLAKLILWCYFTVGDIPDPGRVTRNRSRDDVSSVMSSNLQVRSTTKSFSIFAPWTPRHYNDQYDVHYAQKPKQKDAFKKSSSTKNLTDDKPSTLQKNKSYSHTTLSRRTPNQNHRLTSSSTALHRREKRGKENDISQNTISRRSNGKKSQSSEILSKDDREKVSRSVSIPKEKKAGWFKLSNKNKKQENTRVR